MIQIITLILKLVVAPLVVFSWISGWGISHSIPTIISYVMGGAAAFGTIKVTAMIPV